MKNVKIDPYLGGSKKLFRSDIFNLAVIKLLTPLVVDDDFFFENFNIDPRLGGIFGIFPQIQLIRNKSRRDGFEEVVFQFSVEGHRSEPLRVSMRTAENMIREINSEDFHIRFAPEGAKIGLCLKSLSEAWAENNIERPGDI